MAVRKKGLGKGLDSMFPSYNKESSADEKNNNISANKKETTEKNSKASKETDVKSRKKEAKQTGSEKKRTTKGALKNDVSRETSEEFRSGEEKSITEKKITGKAAGKIKSVNNDSAKIEEQKSEINNSEAAKSDPDIGTANSDGTINLKITEVEPNRDQPRKFFDEDALQELSDSIKQYGVLQPLIVQKRENYYEIIAGERRWRAAKLAGLKEVPVIIRDYSEQEIMEIALIENIQRENLNPIEEAQAYRKLLDDFGMKQDELAEKVSKSRTAITNALRLLKLDERVRQMLVDELITAGHARALLGLNDSDQQYELAQRIFDEKISVREVEKIVKKMNEQQQEEPEVKVEKDDSQQLLYKNIEDRMKNILGTKVLLNKKSSKKGKIEIEYYSDEDLERIFDLILSIPIQP